MSSVFSMKPLKASKMLVLKQIKDANWALEKIQAALRAPDQPLLIDRSEYSAPR